MIIYGFISNFFFSNEGKFETLECYMKCNRNANDAFNIEHEIYASLEVSNRKVQKQIIKKMKDIMTTSKTFSTWVASREWEKETILSKQNYMTDILASVNYSTDIIIITGRQNIPEL